LDNVSKDEFEKFKDETNRRVSFLEQCNAAGGEKFAAIKEDINEVKDGQKWATRYALGTLVTIIIFVVAQLLSK
jgi:hypothetical protein